MDEMEQWDDVLPVGSVLRSGKREYRVEAVLGKGGFGIGLCTAREFARAMGGDLTLAANDPHGCVFTLELPK